MSVALLILCLILAPLFFWAGFLARRRIFPWRPQVAFFASLVLAAFMAYVVWRQHRTVSALRDLIGPLPEITSVTYVPSRAELAAFAQILSTLPGGGRLSANQPGELQALAARFRERGTEYWLLRSALSPDSILAFFRNPAGRKGWQVKASHPPWLFLARESETLFLFATDDWPRPETKILVGYSSPSR